MLDHRSQISKKAKNGTVHRIDHKHNSGVSKCQIMWMVICRSSWTNMVPNVHSDLDSDSRKDLLWSSSQNSPFNLLSFGGK